MARKMRNLVAAAAVSLGAMIGGTTSAQQVTPEAKPLTPADIRAERSERLRAILQLRPNQEAPLQSYLTALEGVGRRMRALAGPYPPTMPERVGRMQHIMAEGVKAMDVVAAATRGFYDQLDPGQKRAYDALPMQAVMHGETPALGMAGGVLTSLDPLYVPAAR